MKIKNTLSFTMLMGLILFSLVGCSRQETQTPREDQPRLVIAETRANVSGTSAPPMAFQPVSVNAVTETETPTVDPPKSEDITAVLARTYQNAVTLVNEQKPNFVVGDFNGDGSEDIAITVKPNESMLTAINDEFANWILEDPKNVPIPGTPSTAVRAEVERQPVRAEKGDSLLAIVHGAGLKGWRNPEARQTYLLKHVVGKLSVQNRNEFNKARGPRQLPTLRTDVIRETAEGKTAIILWIGAKYSWYGLSVNP
ncbi:MAG: hypothetical protein ABR555_13455 [Pyrinomonadaceae bacterium]